MLFNHKLLPEELKIERKITNTDSELCYLIFYLLSLLAYTSFSFLPFNRPHVYSYIPLDCVLPGQLHGEVSTHVETKCLRISA